MLFFDELRVVMNRANSLAASFRSENAETLIPFVSWNVARDSGPFRRSCAPESTVFPFADRAGAERRPRSTVAY